jgi:hypothetical protein
LALAVPLSRFTPRVGGGSAFFVRRLARMKNITIFFLASMILAGIGCWLSPLSTAFILAAIAWGVIYLVLRFACWKSKSSWLPSLVFWLVVIVGMRCSLSWIFPGVRTGSVEDWSLGLLYVGIVGIVVFGFRLLFLIAKARHSI